MSFSTRPRCAPLLHTSVASVRRGSPPPCAPGSLRAGSTRGRGTTSPCRRRRRTGRVPGGPGGTPLPLPRSVLEAGTTGGERGAGSRHSTSHQMPAPPFLVGLGAGTAGASVAAIARAAAQSRSQSR